MADSVLAALSASPAATSVLGFAKLLASLSTAEVTAVHIGERPGARSVLDLTAGEEVGLTLLDGDPVREIERAAARLGVGLVVAGAHLGENGRGPGWVSRELAIRIDRPLLVVPARAIVPESLGRVLVPLEGTAATTAPIRALFERFPFDANAELVMMHTFTHDDMPPFANHEPHEADAWVHAFRERYVPAGLPAAIMMRCGPAERVVPEVADAIDATLTVVAWSQVMAPGRALLVKTLLADPRRPTLLLPATCPRVLPVRLNRQVAASGR